MAKKVKAAAKKPAVKKTAPKKAVAKKKAAPKKAAVKKAAPKKAAAKKTAPKKPAPKKPAVKKQLVKKATTAKPAPKKPVTGKPAATKKTGKNKLPPVIQMAHDMPTALPAPEQHIPLPEPGIIPIDVQIEKVLRNEDPLRVFDKNVFKKATAKGDPRHNMPISSKPKRSKMPSAKKPLWRK